MGFDGLFFARADYRDKDQRKENKTLRARADVLLDIMVSFLSPLVILILESNS